MTETIVGSSIDAPTSVTLADERERTLIREDLDTSYLVEAGAGSGKTTSLVDRMLTHVLRGTTVESLAAVTFTRKTAGELRERFQLRLERALIEGRRDGWDPERVARVEAALRGIDRTFLGTIHSFCARLLRERPLEARLDPEFVEVSELDWDTLRDEFWRRWLERRVRGSDPSLAALADVGVRPDALAGAFETMIALGDVTLPCDERPLPDVDACRRALQALVARGRALMPARPIEGRWDDLQSTIRRLSFQERTSGWRTLPELADALESLSKSSCKVTQKCWGADAETKKSAKAYGEEFLAFVEGEARAFLTALHEHRYPLVVRALREACDAFEAERLGAGRLGFEDLLTCTVRLLREHPGARAELGARYRFLMIDEFQDTDPRLAELCLLLASDPSEGDRWTAVTPRPGALFVVGDPKQSIYRFRRADISTYEAVRGILARCGDVLRLTVNFRSVPAIAGFVNAHFAAAFPEASSAEQAAFAPMNPAPPRDDAPPAAATDGVHRYVLRPNGTGSGAILAEDAERVASWIAARVARGECAPSDVLILTYQTRHIAWYARALAARNIPARTTGAPLMLEDELHELVLVLRLLADPDNGVLVAAVLEGLFFGCSPADLYAMTRADERITITHAPSDAPIETAKGESIARVRAALGTLHAWWRASQHLPADVVLERVLDEGGLLAHAAAADLGDGRAGALLHLVRAVRDAARAGEVGLTAAIARVEIVLGAAGADASLRPGHEDAVRIMNLHKAKGLEAPIVVLAAPVDRDPKAPTLHVTRDEHGRAIGGVQIATRAGNATRVIAQPGGWAEMAEREARFLDAEWDRLLYVATTRARRELVVSTLDARKKDGSAASVTPTWSALTPSLDTHARSLELPLDAPPGRRAPAATADDLRARVAAVEAARRSAGRVGLHVQTVTEEAKRRRGARDVEPSLDGDRVVRVARPAAGRGEAWGSAVHRVLEQVARGRQGASLTAFARAVARDEALGDGEVDALLAAVERAAASAAWASMAGGAQRVAEWPVVASEVRDGVTHLVEGVLDAAALVDGAWRIVDWKTDAVDDATWRERRDRYERQVARYAEMMRRLTAIPASGVVERVLA